MLKTRTAAIVGTTTKTLGIDAGHDAPTRETLSVLGLPVIPGGASFDLEAARSQGAVGLSGASDEQELICVVRAIAAGQAA